MELYAGIDLHSNNSVVVVLDEHDRVVYRKRLPNDLGMIVAALRSCAGTINGVAVESTFNWYWLVDGLQDAGYAVQLVNTAAVKQYDGLKHSGDFSDARHLAHLLRLGILPDRLHLSARGACRARPAAQAQPARAPAHHADSEHAEPDRSQPGCATPAATRSSAGKANIDAMALLAEQKQALQGQPGGDALPRRADRHTGRRILATGELLRGVTMRCRPSAASARCWR